jgi:hypothetical protein
MLITSLWALSICSMLTSLYLLSRLRVLEKATQAKIEDLYVLCDKLDKRIDGLYSS